MTDANTLLLAIMTTEFISALVITNECLQYLRGLTTSLQEEAKISEINTLTASLKEVREQVNYYHSRWYETVSEMCDKVGTTPSMPRIWSRQSHRASTPASSPSEYFKRTITIPLLDHLQVELEKRFSLHQKTAFQGLYLVPSLLVKECFQTVHDVLLKVGELYSGDLPNIYSLRS